MDRKDLGKRETTGRYAPAISNDGSNPFGNGFWAARIDTAGLARVPVEIYRITSRGPSGLQLQLYVDNQLVSATTRASLNEWTAQGDPIPVDPGQLVSAYWNSAATPAPYLAIYLRGRT